MKCINCGKEIANNSVFCEYCGTKVAQYDNAILTILNNALADEAPMKALKACKKCYKICKAERPYDYKERINLLMHERFPGLWERCQLEEKKHKQHVAFYILLTTFIVCLLICLSIVFFVIELDVDILLDHLSYTETITFYMCSIIGFVSLILIFFRKKIV